MQSTAQHLPPDESIQRVITEKCDVSSLAFEARQSCLSRGLLEDGEFQKVATDLVARNVKEVEAILLDSESRSRLPPDFLRNLVPQIFKAEPGRYEDTSNFVSTKLLLAAAVQQLAGTGVGVSPPPQHLAEEEFKKIVVSGELRLLTLLEPFFQKDYFFTPQGADLLLTAFKALAEIKPKDCSLDSFPFEFMTSPQYMNDPRFVGVRAGLFKGACEAGDIPPLLWSVSAASIDPKLFAEITGPGSSRSIIQGIDLALECDKPSDIFGLLPIIGGHAESDLLKAALSERATKWVLEVARGGGIRNGEPLYNEMLLAGTTLSHPAAVCSERFVLAVKEGITKLLQDDIGLPPLYILSNLVPGSYALALSNDSELSSAVRGYLQRVVDRTRVHHEERASPHRIPIRILADIQQTVGLIENIYGLDSTCSQALDALLPKPGLFLRICGLADRLSIRAMSKATCPVRAVERAIKRRLHELGNLEDLTPQAINAAIETASLASHLPHLPSLYRLQKEAEMVLLRARISSGLPDDFRERVLSDAMRFLYPTDPLLERALAASLELNECKPEVAQGRAKVLSHLRALKHDSSPDGLRLLAEAFRGKLFDGEEMRDVQERAAKTVEQLSLSR